MSEGHFSSRDHNMIYDENDENSNSRLLHYDTSKRASILTTNRRYPDMLRKRPKTILAIALTLSVILNVALLSIVLKPQSNIFRMDNSSSSCDPSPEDSTPDGNNDQTVINSQLSESAQSSKVQTSQNMPTLKCPPQSVAPCPSEHPNLKKYETPRENLFEDLSSAEIQAVYSYFAKQPDFKIKPEIVGKANHVYGIELHIPNKSEAIRYIDGKGPKPAREARVVVERQDLSQVQEFVVGPLPKPTYHKTYARGRTGPIPYRFSPMYGYQESFHALIREMTGNRDLMRLIKESYSATFRDCKPRCLILLPQFTSSAYSSTSLIVYSVYYATDFVTINPVGLMFVMKENAENSLAFQVHAVHYAGETYKNIRALTTAYKYSTTPKTKISFPSAGSPAEMPGTMHLRGRLFPASDQMGPVEYEPQGRRYKVSRQHVQYLEWSFSLRMSTASGPQLWDIRWAGERIAHEISLQEVGVIYAGANPTSFYSHLSDSAFGLGSKSQGLVRGVDCPEHATFLPQTVYDDKRGDGKVLPNAICIFEHNEGRPLRRHKSNDVKNGKNYGGLVDRVLIVRSIIVEYNYDYIFDAVFHQNGALEMKCYATGYVLSQRYYKAEDPFGFKITNGIVGSVHHHVFNFKVDMDILGQNNRYGTLDFTTDNTNRPWAEENFEQIAFTRNVKKTEKEALYKFNFQTPKYHLVYNDQEKNTYGGHRAYRLSARGFSHQILSDDSVVMRSRRWMQYQMVTTRHKDWEAASSSIYSMFDGDDPVADISRYWQDDESIIDQDLVFWVTLGMHHIPHTEDIPNTPTVGTEVTLTLSPYNYFTECPSTGARDSIRADLGHGNTVTENHGTQTLPSCLPHQFDIKNVFSSNNVFYR